MRCETCKVKLLRMSKNRWYCPCCNRVWIYEDVS